MEINQSEDYKIKLGREKKIIIYSIVLVFFVVSFSLAFLRKSDLFLGFIIVAFFIFLLVTAPFLLVYFARSFSKSNAPWYSFLGDRPLTPGQGDKDFVRAVEEKLKEPDKKEPEDHSGFLNTNTNKNVRI